MKRLLLALSLSFSGGQAFAQGAPPRVPAATEVSKPVMNFIANGEEVAIPNVGFIITPPVGWEVLREGSGASLLFQAPKPKLVPGVAAYRPNIRVMVFGEPKPMDDATKDEFSKIIVDKYSVISSSVANYMVRSSEKVQLQSGINAYLYYTEFLFDSVPTMQMHILVSSGRNHFLMTYTDLASVFEAPNSPGLATAYTSMQGIKLDSAPPERFLQYYYIGGGILALLIFMMMVRLIRVQRMKKLGERIESDDGGDPTTDDDGYGEGSSVSEISDIASHREEDEDEEAHGAQPMTTPPRKAERPSAPRASAPAPARAPAPVPAKPKVSVSAPAPAPRQANFEGRTRKNALQEPPEVSNAVPLSEAAPLSDTWNLDASASRNDNDDEPEHSEISEIRAQPPVASATKSRHQNVKAPVQPPEPSIEDVSNVALLSDILPNTGKEKKKKGLFGWGKGKKKDDDDADDDDGEHTVVSGRDSDGDEDWDKASRTKARDRGVKAESPAPKPKAKAVSQAKTSSSAIANSGPKAKGENDGWNLSESHGDSDSEEDDD